MSFSFCAISAEPNGVRCPQSRSAALSCCAGAIFMTHALSQTLQTHLWGRLKPSQTGFSTDVGQMALGLLWAGRENKTAYWGGRLISQFNTTPRVPSCWKWLACVWGGAVRSGDSLCCFNICMHSFSAVIVSAVEILVQRWGSLKSTWIRQKQGRVRRAV